MHCAVGLIDSNEPIYAILPRAPIPPKYYGMALYHFPDCPLRVHQGLDILCHARSVF